MDRRMGVCGRQVAFGQILEPCLLRERDRVGVRSRVCRGSSEGAA